MCNFANRKQIAPIYTEGINMKDVETNNSIVNTCSQSLIQDLRQIIEQARGRVAATANYALSMMYWHIGERINRDVLDNKRAEYGKQIVASVARQLREEYGSKGFDEKNIPQTYVLDLRSLLPRPQAD